MTAIINISAAPNELAAALAPLGFIHISQAQAAVIQAANLPKAQTAPLEDKPAEQPVEQQPELTQEQKDFAALEKLPDDAKTKKGKGGRPPKVAAPEIELTAVDEKPAETVVEPPSLQDATAALRDLVAAATVEDGRALLKEFDAAKMSELPAEKRAAFIARAVEITAAKKAG